MREETDNNDNDNDNQQQQPPMASLSMRQAKPVEYAFLSLPSDKTKMALKLSRIQYRNKLKAFFGYQAAR